MTCIEKLRELHPDWDDEKVEYYIRHSCPVREYIRRRPLSCGAHGWEDSDAVDCEECWNREIHPDESLNKHQLSVWLTGEDMRRAKHIADRLGISCDKVVAAALKLFEEELDTYGESISN